MKVQKTNDDFLRKVFSWMFLGLIVSAITAYSVTSVPAMTALATTPVFFWGVLITEFILVLILSAAIKKLSPMAATWLFMLYAGMSGLTIGVILLMYSIQAAGLAFLTTAGMFGATSLYGYYTKADLSTFGMILFMALVGIIIASLLNLFLQSPALYWIVTYLAVLIFAGLTAYDVYQLKKLQIKNPEEAHKAAILGALSLYLNFVNMFLNLLSIFGDRN